MTLSESESLLDYIRRDPDQTTAQYEADLECRRRLGCLPASLPANGRELREWLAALREKELLELDGEVWRPALERLPVDPQGSLFV